MSRRILLWNRTNEATGNDECRDTTTEDFVRGRLFGFLSLLILYVQVLCDFCCQLVSCGKFSRWREEGVLVRICLSDYQVIPCVHCQGGGLAVLVLVGRGGYFLTSLFC